MKWSLFCYCALTFSLAGCQFIPSTEGNKEQQVLKPEVHELEQAVEYGANFAVEFDNNPNDTCIKYKQLFEQGDWRAGWLLALQVDEANEQSCLDNTEAVLILTTLESEKKINSELIWINRYHIRLLKKIQQTTKKMGKLNRSVSYYKKQVTDLKALNQEQLEKLEALKAIATSINNH